MNRNRMLKQFILLLGLISLVSTWAYADKKRDRDDRDDRYEQRDRRGHEQPPKDYRIDKHYQHNRYYPPHGYTITKLPPKHYPVHYHDTHYYFYSGIWYRPLGARFVVVAPPIGLVIPILPPYYTTIWVGGSPYYYANDVYYVWAPDRNGYVVTNPPSGINEEQAPLLSDELFIYPKQGQSEQKQADDRYACHQWGVKQTGYDPTRLPNNLSQPEINRKRDDYQRAMKACLEGRGYSVR